MAKTIDPVVAAIEAVMGQMVTLHEELLALLIRKHGAVRKADVEAMAQLCGLENEKLQAISELEKQRQELAAKLTLLLNPKASEPLRVAQLAEKLPEPSRGRLLVMRQQLRAKLESVKEQTAIARRAADTLVRHVQGLVQGVTAATTQATYTRNPAQPQRHVAPRLSTFSLTA